MGRHSHEIPRIDYPHMKIHDGYMFRVYNDEATMATTEAINIAFKTPAVTSATIHMFIDCATAVGGLLEVLEGATWTAQSGTKFVPLNANRNSATTSLIKGNETTTVFTAGEVAIDVTTVLTTNATVPYQVRLFGANKSPNETRGEIEVILKADTLYVIRFTALGASNGGHLNLVWYEEINDIA